MMLEGAPLPGQQTIPSAELRALITGLAPRDTTILCVSAIGFSIVTFGFLSSGTDIGSCNVEGLDRKLCICSWFFAILTYAVEVGLLGFTTHWAREGRKQYDVLINRWDALDNGVYDLGP